MAYDGWIEFDGQELVNLSRTAQLAETLGIDVLWTDPASVQWIEDALTGSDYDVITEAPWYDVGFPASAEFAGVVPLSIVGLDDSTLEATTIEYNTNGGASGKPRNKTLPLVANVAIIASTSRGADYGKRWLDRRLRAGGARTFCSGSDLRYFQFPQGEGEPVPPQMHRRDVTLTRGTSVTRKRATSCSATWLVTFTWTANDPFEYGDEVLRFLNLGSGVVSHDPAMDVTYGQVALVEQECPAYDYSPIYDPLYPALVPSPTVPDFYPAGWHLVPGMTFERYWVRFPPLEPSTLNVVPVMRLTTNVAARLLRISVWPSTADPAIDFCEPMWTAIVSYLPANLEFVIDGEQEASYAWDGVSPEVRRTDSLVYGTDARPIEWTSFSDADNLLVTLDILNDTGSGEYDGDGEVRMAMSLVPKSD